ncbi:HAD-IIIC family phosphatase [Aeromonas sobria]|uniref:HAD-IIIC family phosphatase n=1 Tax=Aeromonas sobria TaxID=646 RepID=UPI001E5FC5FA|nr:HAD-IIIC family phosphatase [Aeromonas sobria]
MGDLYPWMAQLEVRFSLALKRHRIRDLGLGRWLSESGRRNCVDERNRYLFSCPLSMQGLAELADWITARWMSDQTPVRKVLVLDCDNTLWGGVVGEDGLMGLTLGQDGSGKLYQAFQEAVLYWYRRGILLALCSKNEPDDVWRVFAQHGAMRLIPSQIAASAIGWGCKSQGLREIADSLNLGLDALVFWDDAPLERAEVRRVLPQVDVIEPPDEIWAWPNTLLAYEGFSRTLSGDDFLRQASYLAMADAEQLRSEAGSERHFLATLSLRASLHPLGVDNLTRAEQLTHKTNQFNLACQRHMANEIVRLAQDGWCWLVSLQDCFAEHGLVGLVLIVKTSPTQAFLDTLALSCRVLSRGLENWLLTQVASQLRAAGVCELILGASTKERNGLALDWIASLSVDCCENPDPARFPHENCYRLALDNLNLPFVEFYHHE